MISDSVDTRPSEKCCSFVMYIEVSEELIKYPISWVIFMLVIGPLCRTFSV